jgi:hypothetical protein
MFAMLAGRQMRQVLKSLESWIQSRSSQVLSHIFQYTRKPGVLFQLKIAKE